MRQLLLAFNRFFLFLSCLLIFSGIQAFSTGSGETVDNTSYKALKKRSFNTLNLAGFDEPESETPFYTEELYQPVSKTDDEIRNAIEATFQKVVSENRFIDFLDENALVELPVGIKKEVGGLTYTILIDSLIFTPNEFLLYASMSFEAPNLGKLHFRGTDIRFSKSGGIVDGGKLELVGDYPITLPGKKSQFVVKGNDRKTFVEFDCNGFKQMSLDASMVFSRDLMVPVDGKGKEIPNENVALSFTTTLMDWNDLLVEAGLPRFEVKGLDDVIFEVQDAVLDFSDYQNAPGVVFPANYSQTSSYLQSGSPELWRGVFIKNLTVTLPQQFESTPEGTSGAAYSTRVSFSGTNMLIDNQGFSGILSAKNLIPIEKGSLGNWSFSLDDIHIALVANSITSGGFSGKIDIPISSKTEGQSAADQGSRLFKYTAMIKPGNEYLFNVSNPDKIEFSLWNAGDVELKPSSYVEVRLKDGKFLPKAHLSGKMTINAGLSSKDGAPASDSKKNLLLKDITFEDLEIQSVKPYVSVRAFSLGTNENAMGGFPITVNKIGGGQKGDELFLDIDLTLTLTNKNDGAFGAGGGVRVVTEAVENGRKLGYRFKKVEMQRFGIDIDQGSFKFKGNLNFYREDPVYGNGISGTIDATFADAIELQASAIFGTVEGTRYWYVDALADFGKGIPVFTGVYINRFGGGASYHMALDTKGSGSPLGKTASGMVYVPDRTVGLGLKAMVGIKGEDEKLFNADVTFEMAFRSGGGVKYINFRGNAYIMSDPVPVSLGELSEQSKKLAEAAKSGGEINQNSSVASSILGDPDTKGASIYAGININYDFDHKTLHANLSVRINVSDGLMTGRGDAVMHFSPDEWYIYIGRPEYENRFRLQVLGLAELSTYFVMGSVVPDTPPPPSEVSEILGGVDLNYMDDLNALADGAGIGFGASLRIDTGDKSFLIFYGRFKAGLGFDVMLKDYGGATCKGRGKLGVNGWYANGQAYAYFDGKIGIKVKLFGRTKKVDILSIGAAVVLQAKLPNPFWARGIVGGHYSVLGGMVKGRCSFEVTIGEECDLQNNSSVLEGVEVIAQLTPQNGARGVDVFSSPQAVFNYELEKSYHTTGYNDERVTFKIGLDKFEITGPEGKVDAELVWNADKTISVLKASDILPPKTELSLVVTTSFQELKNGSWEIAKSDGEALRETKSIKFTTGEAPDYIPENNVAYSYPTRSMLNFYKDEYGEGYVKLNQGQDYLFEDPEFSHIVRFSAGGEEIETSLKYSNSNNEVTFQVPSALVADQAYQLNFVSVPKLQTDIEANVSATESAVSEAGVDATVRTRSATGSVKNYEEQELYGAYFRTSKYNTFKEKVVSVKPSKGWRFPLFVDVHLIGSYFESPPEPFSYEEVMGREGATSIIQFEADLSSNSWYNENIFPLIYKNYPLPGNIRIAEDVRDVSVYGIVPVKAIQLTQYPFDFYLQESDLYAKPLSFRSSYGSFEYQLAYYMYKDYVNLKGQAARHMYNTGSQNVILKNLVESNFPPIKKGDYYMNINYVLPGRNTVTTSYNHKIYNPIN